MNHKQQAAKEAVTLIQTGWSVGLGAGATMEYMVSFLKENTYLNIHLYTSSATTKTVLLQHGFLVNDIANAASLDIYFDGCDQFDTDLNALKSGAGIHTMEKLFASMAKAFVLVGDDTKFSEKLETRYPLVLEVLPQAVCFVSTTLQQSFTHIKIQTRINTTTQEALITQNGNQLIDVWFTQFPDLATLNPAFKTITGIVETSLFYNMATKAVIAGNEGVKMLAKDL